MGVQLTQEMINGAILTQQQYGVPASVTLAQIMLESGGDYEGGLSGLAYNDNNLFGIKAGSSWTGKTVEYKTWEVDGNGQRYQTTAKFRKYDNVQDSIIDHGKLLNSSIYTNKTAGAKTLEEYVRAMGSVYATDPNYANKVLQIIEDNNLITYDMMSYGDVTSDYVPSVEGAETTGIINGEGFGGAVADLFNFDEIWGKIVSFIVIILLGVLAVVFFTKAFNVNLPTPNINNGSSEVKKDVAKKTVKKVVTKAITKV